MPRQRWTKRQPSGRDARARRFHILTSHAGRDGKSQLVYGGGSNSSGELGLGSDHPFVFVTIPRAATLPKDMLARMRKEGTSPVVTAGLL